MPRFHFSRVSIEFVAGVASLLLPVVTVSQDLGVTTSNLNLRRGPSVESRRITVISRGDTLQILHTPARNNYYRVVSAENDTGWVWAARVQLIAASPQPEANVPTPLVSAAPPSGPSWSA